MNQPTNMTEFNYSIPMLKKGFDMVELLTHYPEGVSMLEIAQVLQLSKTTVYRVLGSLQQMGYVTKNEVTARYYLTKKLLCLSLKALGEENIVEIALPIMQALRDEIKESVMLGVLIENRVMLLAHVIGSHSFTFLLRSGNTFNLHSSAPGKVLVAFAKEKEYQDLLLNSIEYTRYNDRTITSREEMLKEIDKIRTEGYAVDAEEEMRGVHCVSTPVFNQFGVVVAALWTSGPSGRLLEENFPATAQKLKEASALISSKLGYC